MPLSAGPYCKFVGETAPPSRKCQLGRFVGPPPMESYHAGAMEVGLERAAGLSRAIPALIQQVLLGLRLSQLSAPDITEV